MNNMTRQALSRCKHNSFNMEFYSVDIMFDEFAYSILRFLNRPLAKEMGEDAKVTAIIDAIMNKVPPFQRGNDKWTADMQSAFVRNVLMGLKPPALLLYTLKESYSNCWVLDGLQRITSMLRFVSEPQMLIDFGDGVKLTSEEIMSHEPFVRLMWNLAVPIRIFTFKNELQAVNHYIDINDQISHSQQDIERARRYRDGLIAQGMVG